MKKYFPIKTAHGNNIEVEVYYSLGGYNVFTYETEKRGIYLSVGPIELSDGMVCFTAFSGSKIFLEELKRKNAKKLAEWEKRIEPIAEQIAKAFVEQNGAEIMWLINAA